MPLLWGIHCLCHAVRDKHPELVETVIILHGNARAHSAYAVKNVLQCWEWEVLQHHPYSPDLSLCGYDLILIL